MSLSELIKKLEVATGREGIVRLCPEQPGDMPATWADITKARDLLGYSPDTTIDDGLAKFVHWYQAAHTT